MNHLHLSAYDKDCEHCLAIKTTVRGYNRVGNQDIISGRILIDLMGPFGTKNNIFGYIATIIIDSSDETIALVLDKKSDFFTHWQPVASKIETSYGTQIKMIQCDGGGEFINQGMLDWIAQKGIQLILISIGLLQ